MTSFEDVDVILAKEMRDGDLCNIQLLDNDTLRDSSMTYPQINIDLTFDEMLFDHCYDISHDAREV